MCMIYISINHSVVTYTYNKRRYIFLNPPAFKAVTFTDLCKRDGPNDNPGVVVPCQCTNTCRERNDYYGYRIALKTPATL